MFCHTGSPMSKAVQRWAKRKKALPSYGSGDGESSSKKIGGSMAMH